MMERGLGLILVGVVVGLLSGSVSGAIIDGDPAAIISGSEAYSTVHWIADIDYAVYAPGGYPGTHVDKATSYIYAYQVSSSGDSSATLSVLSAGLGLGSGAASPTDDGGYGILGGVAPLLPRLVGSPPTSVAWAISIAPGENTTVLLFSSPNPHTFGPATLANGGVGDEHPLPTPIPEPATMSLLAVAGLALLRKRR